MSSEWTLVSKGINHGSSGLELADPLLQTVEGKNEHKPKKIELGAAVV